MANKKQVIDSIVSNEIIAILRGIPASKLVLVVKALLKGGVSLIEIPFDESKKISDQETISLISLLNKEFKDQITLGAGTVLTVSQVRAAKKAGAKYIISPNTNKRVIRSSLRNKLVSIPGAFTPTEVAEAIKLKADFIKIFPTGEISPSYFNALKAPYSGERFLAVAGVTLENIKEYKEAGAVGFGISSGIVSKEALKNENYQEITQKAKEYINALK